MKTLLRSTGALIAAVMAFGTAAGAQYSRYARAAAPTLNTASGDLASIAPNDPADSLYRAARAALTDGDYRRAAAMFKQVVDKYPKSDLVGDAQYWRAWSLYKFGADNRTKSDLDEAFSVLQRYVASYGKNG